MPATGETRRRIRCAATTAEPHALSRDYPRDSGPDGLWLQGCGLNRNIAGPRSGDYVVTISIIAPHIDLATDGKEPALAPFSEAIATVVRKACNAAYRAMDKPPGGMEIKEAAWQVMPDAYRIASTGGTLPANARQIMYAARPAILELTGKTKLDDRYFTQALLPDYIEEHPEITANWDVVFDDRGSFIEPHTGQRRSARHRRSAPIPWRAADARNSCETRQRITGADHWPDKPIPHSPVRREGRLSAPCLLMR